MAKNPNDTTATTLMTRESVRAQAQEMQKPKAAEPTSLTADAIFDDNAVLHALVTVGDGARDKLVAALQEATYVAPRHLSFKEGMTVEGILVGKGETDLTQTHTDQRTGEVYSTTKTISVYFLQQGKIVGRILGAHEIDQALKNKPADGTLYVTIYRGKDELFDGGTKRVGRYFTVARPSGLPSNVAQLPEVVAS